MAVGARTLAFEAMAAQSATYAAAVDRLLQERRISDESTEIFNTVAVPIAALSIEIGLKALGVYHARISSTREPMDCVKRFEGHDLKAWFFATPDAVQSSIRERLSETKLHYRSHFGGCYARSFSGHGY